MPVSKTIRDMSCRLFVDVYNVHILRIYTVYSSNKKVTIQGFEGFNLMDLTKISGSSEGILKGFKGYHGG